jgi:hypothetical protein
MDAILISLVPRLRGDGGTDKNHAAANESLISSVNAVAIELTPDEALVLFEWLYRFNDSGDATFRDQAEQRVLWNIEGVLDSNVAAVLDPQYD